MNTGWIFNSVLLANLNDVCNKWKKQERIEMTNDSTPWIEVGRNKLKWSDFFLY